MEGKGHLKISVIGAGGIGSAMAAYLSRAGHDVTLVFKDKEDAEIVRSKGLTVSGRHAFNVKVQVVEWPTPIPASDLLVVAVKTYDTEEALSVAKGVPIGMAISAQNGIQKETIIRELLSKEVVVGAVIQVTAMNKGGGNIFHPGITPSYVGELDDGISDKTRFLARLLSEAAIPTEVTDNIRSVEWTKTCQWVATSVLSVMTGYSYSSIFSCRWLTPLFIEIVRECVGVARADGATIVVAPGLFVYDLVNANDEAAYALLQNTGKELEARWYGYRASMLLDIERRSETEFHDIVGYVHRKAIEHRVSAPALDFAIRQVSKYVVPLVPSGGSASLHKEDRC
jgi:2-dehydropantoate 2-reductase